MGQALFLVLNSLNIATVLAKDLRFKLSRVKVFIMLLYNFI